MLRIRARFGESAASDPPLEHAMPLRLAAIAALAASLALAACANTVRGVGQDLKDTGNAVADVVS